MADPTVLAGPVAPGKTTKSATIALCWCESTLAGMVSGNTVEQKLKTGIKGDDVRELHEHLQRFGFELELWDHSKPKAPVASSDLNNKSWGKFTARAVTMFALHPEVGTDPAQVIVADGAKLTNAIAEKIRLWCRSKVVSPKDYWNFAQLKVGSAQQTIDAFGCDVHNIAKQTAYHHHIRQIQSDLALTGFTVHKDTLCGLGKSIDPDGQFHETTATATDAIATDLRDLTYMIRKFQRQAQWYWRMDTSGTNLADIAAGDASHYGGALTGIMDQATAKVLHQWVTAGLHMVIKKFELKELHWPPSGTTTITNSPASTAAALRSDAYDKWLLAATDIEAKDATIGGSYASSPRGWKGGKPSSPGAASAFSWHYSALGFDLDQAPASGDGTVSAKFRYVLEEDGDRFRLWCFTGTQKPAPARSSDDKTDLYVQYRNRNIKTKVDASGANLDRDATKSAESDPAPLAHMCNDFVRRTAKEGWYVDLTRILEDNNLMRIKRHSNWTTNPKAWEWWHYQFDPGMPPGATEDLTFGDYLQLFGVHEYEVRAKNWSSHKDVNHPPG